MIEYELRPDLVAICAHAGCQRQIENMMRRRVDAYGFKGDPWGAHIDGCIGEYVLCLHLKQPWDGKGKFRGPDVGVREQVRTRLRHDWQLLVHREDKDADRFWLITGEDFIFRVHGWIWGHEAKQEKHWKDFARNGRPAFWLKQSDLYPATANDFVLLRGIEREVMS